MANPVGDGTTHYEVLARDPTKPKSPRTFGPRQASGGTYSQGHVHGSPDGHWVCMVASTTEHPPTQPGQSNDHWHWSNGS